MCGCLVIGYDGRGGREYFKDEVSYPIEGGDIISFAKTVEEVIGRYNMNQSMVGEKRQKASEFIKKTYSPEKQTEEIVRCWKQIIAKSDSQG